MLRTPGWAVMSQLQSQRGGRGVKEIGRGDLETAFKAKIPGIQNSRVLDLIFQ